MKCMKIDAGLVYFIERLDQGRRSYKIGWTARTAQERLTELETEYDAKLRVVYTVESPAATLIEGHLHRLNSLTRIAHEWFRFADLELSAAIDEAHRVNRLLDPGTVEAACHFDGTPSNGETLDVRAQGPERAFAILERFSRAQSCRNRLAELAAQQAVPGRRLRELTSRSRGIAGVTTRRRVEGRPYRREAAFQTEYPELYDRLSRPSGLCCQFKLHALGLAAAGEDDESSDDNGLDSGECPRFHEAEEHHARHLALARLAAPDQLELELVALELRAMLAENEGYEGVCSYRRRVERSVDWGALDRTEPQLAARFAGKKADSVRFRVMQYRGYL